MSDLRWYLPPGVARPGHLRPSLAPARLEPGAGPDHAGGMVLGGLYDPSTELRWKRTSAGWWFLGDTMTQRDLDSSLRVRGEPFLSILHEGLQWRVARLLDADLTLLPHLISHVGAITPTGEPTLISVARCESLAERVANFWRGTALVEGDTPANNLAVVRLACEVACQWYHLSEFELFGSGLATWAWADAVLTAAASLQVVRP